jgi:site-specific DNA recombinase
LIEERQQANRSYMEEGIKLLELSRRASELFDKQTATEKRRLLNFVLSNCSWKHGRLTAGFRQPFDMLAVANELQLAREAAGEAPANKFEGWLPTLDAFRTFCFNPGSEGKVLLEGIQQFSSTSAVPRQGIGL